VRGERQRHELLVEPAVDIVLDALAALVRDDIALGLDRCRLEHEVLHALGFEAHAERVTLIRRACAEVRGALLVGGSAANDADLNAIVEDINHQVTALDLRARAYRDLSRL